jgi:hypothetical protein
MIKNYTEYGINQVRYGDPGFDWLRLTDNEIVISATTYPNEPTEFRVMIWKIAEP